MASQNYGSSKTVSLCYSLEFLVLWFLDQFERDFSKLYRQMDLTVQFFWPTTIFKVAIIKTKSATIAFFSSSPFFLLALSFSLFLFLHYCDFGAYRAQKTCLIFTQMTADFVRLVFQNVSQIFNYVNMALEGVYVQYVLGTKNFTFPTQDTG